MTTYTGARGADTKPAGEVDSDSMDSFLDAAVIALIVAGFITLAFNIVARL